MGSTSQPQSDLKQRTTLAARCSLLKTIPTLLRQTFVVVSQIFIISKKIQNKASPFDSYYK